MPINAAHRGTSHIAGAALWDAATARGGHLPGAGIRINDRVDASVLHRRTGIGGTVMIPPVVLRRIHLGAGVVAFLTILPFWTSTVVSELLGGHAAVAAVKNGILSGMLILIPSMAIVGGSGFYLAGRSTAPTVAAKKRRMPIIALNGLLVLVPASVFLAGRANAGRFDTIFYAVQAIELIAGAANLTLMGLNIRDGLRLTHRIGRARAASQAA
jgi:hypothetical protein